MNNCYKIPTVFVALVLSIESNALAFLIPTSYGTLVFLTSLTPATDSTTTTTPSTTTTTPTTTTTTTTIPSTTTTSTTTTTIPSTTTSTTTTTTTTTIPNDPPPTPGAQLILAQAYNGGMVRESNYDGSLQQDLPVDGYPFGATYTGGITLVKGDINGDGIKEIIMAQSFNGGGVKAYDHNRELIIDVKPFGDSYNGGINLACGDIDGEGISEIIAAQASLNGAVKAYKYDGTPSGQEVLSINNPFSEQTGANITTGDLDGDYEDEIIVAQSFGGGTIKVYKYLGNSSFSTLLKFKPFGRKFNGGVNIATGKFTVYDTTDDIAVAQAYNGRNVRVYTYGDGIGLSKVFSKSPFGNTYNDGVGLTLGDVDGDYVDEIVVAQAYNGGDVKGYKDNGTPDGQDVFSLTPFSGFSGGVNVMICN